MNQNPEAFESPETIYIRVYRDNKTIFLVCKLTDGIELIKNKLTHFVKQDPSEMRLYLGNRLLDPTSNIYDQDVKNNSLINLKLKMKTGDYEQ